MISVVIPAYDEEHSIAETVMGVRDALLRAGFQEFEVIVVNDGSRDETGKVAETAGARVIHHPHNVGYGRALKRGIEAATYDTIAICDADGTYPSVDIPVLYSIFRDRGFDMVVGRRHGPHYRESLIKMPLRAVLRFLVEWTAGRKIPDINSGLRVFSKSCVVSYFPHLCDTFSFTTSMTLAYMMTGRFVAYHDIKYLPRSGRTKVRLFKDSLRTLQYIIEAAVYFNPLKIFLLASVLCATISAFMLGISLLLATATGVFLAIGTAMVSIIMLGIGMLAVLLKQIMNKP